MILILIESGRISFELKTFFRQAFQNRIELEQIP